MRRLHSLSISFAVLSAFFVLTGGEARADGTPSQPPKATPTSTTTTTSAEPASTLPADADRERRRREQDEDLKNVSLTANPLGLLIGRYSIQGEFLPAPHHAIVLNPFFAHIPVSVNSVDLGSINGFGGELGYKFYTSSHGPAGFYVSPSILFATYSESSTVTVNGQSSSASQSFTSFGGAIDIGGQAVIGPGVVIGGGFGLQYTKTSQSLDTNDLNLASAIVAGGGIRPRFLFSVGYAF